MIGLAVCIGLLVIFLTMYTTVIERTRDIGVLKSLVANSPFIIRAVLYESASLCLVGIVAGIGLHQAGVVIRVEEEVVSAAPSDRHRKPVGAPVGAARRQRAVFETVIEERGRSVQD